MYMNIDSVLRSVDSLSPNDYASQLSLRQKCIFKNSNPSRLSTDNDFQRNAKIINEYIAENMNCKRQEEFIVC